MPVHLAADTRAAIRDGATLCDSLPLLQQKFPFIDPSKEVKQHHQIALDQFLPEGPADLKKLRENARRDVGHHNVSRALAATRLLEASAPLSSRAAAPAPHPAREAWFEAIPEVRRRTLRLTTGSRLTIGHANGVIENSGLTLHRTRGFPVVPGSAAKNAARRGAAAFECPPEDLLAIFGDQQHAGLVSFLDAYPDDAPRARLEYEVSTPHYSRYYGGRSPSAPDTESPIPVTYPAVAAGVTFVFRLALLNRGCPSERAAELLELAQEFLHEALITLGIGAKTSSGHGHFLPSPEFASDSAGEQSVVLELLTPAITAGARQEEPEIRVASIRGQLRQMYRMLGATPEEEHRLFGGIGRNLSRPNGPVASAISLRLRALSPVTKLNAVSLCPHDRLKGSRAAVAAGCFFELAWTDRFMRTDPAGAAIRNRYFRRVLEAWLLLGGIGCRSTRAAGSVWPAVTRDGKCLRVQYSIEHFEQRVASLNLPPTLRARILPLAGNNHDAEQLRAIATNTVNGVGSGTFHGDPLGFVGGGRKVSPLKLKVGRFSDGFRLIAVWDNRNGRGGDLTSAIQAMKNREKQLGDLLGVDFLNPS